MKWCCFYTIRVYESPTQREIGIVEVNIDWVGNIRPNIGEKIACPYLVENVDCAGKDSLSFQVMGRVTDISHDNKDEPKLKEDGLLLLTQSAVDVSAEVKVEQPSIKAAENYIRKLHKALEETKGIDDAEMTLYT
jgi:hypothetical protein